MQGVYFSEGIIINDRLIGDGISKKVYDQMEQLRQISDLRSLNLTVPKSKLDKVLFLLPIIKSKREKQRHELLKITNKANFLYIRKPSLTLDFYYLLKKIKENNNNITILMELPTFPFHKEYKGLSRLMVGRSVLCERKLDKVVDVILTYSNDKQIWNIPTLRLSNCVDYGSIEMRNNQHLEHDVIRLICVAKFNYWHGLDRLIAGMGQYKGKYNFILNVVGEGEEIPKLRQLANSLGLSNNVIFYGFKTGNDLADIFNRSDIAIDALGRHRSGVFYNSSLKGKEYAARGIPSISGVKTEFDDITDYNYYLKVPADETPIDMKRVAEFYEKIYYSGDSVQQISESIRERSFELFDYSNGFRPVLNYIMKNNKE